MITNRSMPRSTVIPELPYPDDAGRGGVVVRRVRLQRSYHDWKSSGPVEYWRWCHGRDRTTRGSGRAARR